MATAPQTLCRIPGNLVLPATKPLGTVAYETALQHALGSAPLEAYSRDTKNLIPYAGNGYDHGFIRAVHLAYACHYPLTLSPDMIWLLIAQGFAIHVRENAEALRKSFVSHQGKKTIRIERTEFLCGFAGNDWEGVIAEFSEKIRGHIGEKLHNAVVPIFSTTGIVEKAAFEITLMDAMQEYFQFEFGIICGIPQFFLEGTPDDWRHLRACAQALLPYRLRGWLKVLLPVLDEFIAAREGSPNPKFWQSFYRKTHESHVGCGLGEVIDGYVTAFFPYLATTTENQWEIHQALIEEIREAVTLELCQYEDPEEFEANFSIGMAKVRDIEVSAMPKLFYRRSPIVFRRSIEGLTSNNFPSGFSIAPLLLDNLGQRTPIELIAGFVGAAQNSETLAVRPEIGWAVRERKTET